MHTERTTRDSLATYSLTSFLPSSVLSSLGSPSVDSVNGGSDPLDGHGQHAHSQHAQTTTSTTSTVAAAKIPVSQHQNRAPSKGTAAGAQGELDSLSFSSVDSVTSIDDAGVTTSEAWHCFLATTLALMLFSPMGVLLREFLNWLSSDVLDLTGSGHTDPSNPSLISNMIGCAILGLLTTQKRHFLANFVHRSVYAGLATGFCGSLTTFSGWMVYSVELLCRYEVPASSIFAVILGFVSSMCSLYFGHHCGVVVNVLIARGRPHGFCVPVQTSHRFALHHWRGELVILISILATGYTLMPLLMAFVPSTRAALFALILSPIGTGVRWQLSRLNLFAGLQITRRGKFPLGTFLANMIGCICYAFFVILLQCTTEQGNPSSIFTGKGGSALSWVVAGLTAGLCGTVSTVSTMINELYELSTHNAYLYAVFTFGFAYLVLLLILGVYYWAFGSCV
eukprot:CAMPEP_0177645406 /NCGR_PEP_ID=MMETSP0447-20121125/9229_1 /TAXON_ID=0 /ORGANISM="Stygamoeba regulata, Strain BSH-02190019" /LENGTH=451 /DNA_ID=CAMNT_0019147881 /DNA_START=184 /DNA_END=1539 /DNA_ORIENTATION=+